MHNWLVHSLLMREKMKMARNANYAATPHNHTISNPTHIHSHLHNLRDSQPHTPHSQSITYSHSQSCTPHGSAHSHTYNHKTSHHSTSPTTPPLPLTAIPTALTAKHTHSLPHPPHSRPTPHTQQTQLLLESSPVICHLLKTSH